ncbi:MAG: hypothetical protein RJA57_1155, partial [Bacteroidota bacterium]
MALPRTVEDIRRLVGVAKSQGITLIPRAAGTSLAGQVVGNGIVVDCSAFFTRILALNVEERWVRVEPGVIRDDLNHFLRPYGLMFGPETSTANRATIGGMMGNNSCGLHSIVWGTTRDHILEADVVLSDGTYTSFGATETARERTGQGLPSRILNGINDLLSDPRNQQLIRNRFPRPSVHRRNSGYALDSLLQLQPYDHEGAPFNLCKLLAGSEGTLAFVTAVRLNLIPLPPAHQAVVCIHCNSVVEAMHANITALQHRPMASELVDKLIMDF